jgi:hypothetical protein
MERRRTQPTLEAWRIAMKTDIRNLSHWQDAGNLLLAVWLFVSPWLLNYSQEQLPAWNSFAVAIIVGVFAIAAMLKFAKWEEWVNIAVGVWLIISPWLLGYAATVAATQNHVVIGALVIILAGWELNAAEQATSRT